MANLIIIVPIYKPTLDDLEKYSLDFSLAALPGRLVVFIGPSDLNLDYYAAQYPSIQFIGFDNACFASIQGYNRLLLNPAFYQQFSAYEHMLILQTDAIVLRDELDHWCQLPFDYVGAPWPNGVELFVNLGPFAHDNGRRVRAMVGNGGLSLRRISRCISLLQEFPDATDYFNRSGSSEDLFFSLMGSLSRNFILPNEISASMFSLELQPSLYYAINGNCLPMGGHAWWKYDVSFWKKILPPSPLLESLWTELTPESCSS